MLQDYKLGRRAGARGGDRTAARNLIVDHAAPELVQTAELTATAFRAARVSPVLGRGLVDADETPGAAGVVVLGYDVWQRSFGGRADVIGSEAALGSTTATVIGVMPDGFGYLPTLRLDPLSSGGGNPMSALDWSQCPAVEAIPGKVSGAWVFRGTRTPVSLVFENLEAGMTVDEIVEAFPVSH
ncbi:MAG: DUF433 domain-containing protein [Vicinamibacteria bacterium]